MQRMEDFSRAGSRNLRSNIDKLSRLSSKLQRMAATIGTGRDNPSFREKLNEEKDRGMTLIHSIVRMIKQMRARGENPSVKGFEKEARKFQEVIERIRDDESRVVRNSINSGRSSDVDDELTAGLLDGQLQEEAKLTHLEAKKNQIKNLEQDVTELAGMFVDLQGLVNEQQATVDQITVHVEEAKEYTNNAATELEKAERYQRSARRRQLCCCILLLVVLLIVALVIYLLVKK
mmetsp:Transcript_30297/g.42233  ORF Transcript_30297/g.42233 Transcript_30297/m.42233 type:complete len:233 (-) Transcript_30297:411-1109(-)